MGPVDCTLLAAFALRRMLDPRTGGTSTWERMSSRLDIPLHRFSNPNLPDVARRIRDDKVDIIVSMVGHILAPEILAAPRIGIVAKHASLLPACRGLFPFLWTRLEGIPVGVSFFVLDKGIDSGRVLLRRRYTADPGQVSMLRFYIDVFHAYPNMLVEALDVLLDEGNAGPIDLPSGYYGLPKRDDLARFRREGGRVARWQDLLYQPEARPEAFEP
jgi:methionyl-tRNA formyltransferase